MNTVNIYNFLNHKRVSLNGVCVVLSNEGFEFAVRYAISKSGSHMVSETIAKEAFAVAYNNGLAKEVSSPYMS